MQHVQVSLPEGRFSFSSAQYLKEHGGQPKKKTPMEASTEFEVDSDHELHPGARKMTRKERRRHRKLNDNCFRPVVGGMQGPPPPKAIRERETDVWETANPFQVQALK